MDKFPLYLGEKSTGELTVEPEALYTWFTARCRLPDQELWCAWAVGDAGELRLGILEPSGEEGVIRRRFSRQLTAPLGKLVRGSRRRLGRASPPGRGIPFPLAAAVPAWPGVFPAPGRRVSAGGAALGSGKTLCPDPGFLFCHAAPGSGTGGGSGCLRHGGEAGIF